MDDQCLYGFVRISNESSKPFWLQCGLPSAQAKSLGFREDFCTGTGLPYKKVRIVGITLEEVDE